MIYDALPVASGTSVAHEVAETVGGIDPSQPAFGGLAEILAGLRSRGLTSNPGPHRVGDVLHSAASAVDIAEPSATTGELSSEGRLVKDFETIVMDMSIADVVVPMAGREIAHQDKYWLTPVVASAKETSSDYPAGFEVDLEPLVRPTYDNSPNGKPFLDARQAIGLVYRDKLAAVAAVSADANGVLNVVQIQDVTGQAKKLITGPNPEYYKTGLHNGMDWQATLLAACVQLGRRVEASGMILQANMNSRYAAVRRAVDRGPDKFAARMGFPRDPVTKNWTIPDFPRAESRGK